MTIIIAKSIKRGNRSKNKDVVILSDRCVSCGRNNANIKMDIHKVRRFGDVLVGLTGEAAFINYIDQYKFETLSNFNSEKDFKEVIDSINKFREEYNMDYTEDFVDSITGKKKKVKTYDGNVMFLVTNNKGQLATITVAETDPIVNILTNSGVAIVGQGCIEASGSFEAAMKFDKNKEDLEIMKDVYQYTCDNKPGVGGPFNLDGFVNNKYITNEEEYHNERSSNKK